MERWIGKVAVVTGASSGIGRDIAKTLAERGMVVVALARRKERLDELAASTKGKIYAVKCDVSVEQDILDAFKWIEKTLGGVDVLINNAGIFRIANLTTGQTKKWKDTFDVNVMGLCICTKEALRTMKKRGDCGHIIHINSIGGHYNNQNHKFSYGIYEASKHAVTSLTESLRVELRGQKSKIKITSISPGRVTTEIGQAARKDINVDISEVLEGLTYEPLNPEDITESVIYVLGTKPNVQVHELMIQPVGQDVD